MKFNSILLYVYSFLFLYAGVAIAADQVDLPIGDFVSQAIGFIKLFLAGDQGSFPWAVKVSAAVMLIIASMKVSILRPLWDKLGSAKAWIAPVLGCIGGVISIKASGGAVTINVVGQYFMAGAGAIVIHELFDSIKAVPGLNKYIAMVIDFLQLIFKRPTVAKIAAVEDGVEEKKS